jgi:phi13 family phage major tail protein
MAKIGLNYPVYKTSTAAGVIAKAIQADISIENNDISLYGDDAIAEKDVSFKTGTLTLGITDLSDTIQAALLGHSIADGVMTAKSSDTAPQVGIGFYGVKMVNNIKYYRAIWFPKVQFAEPADNNATKGEAIVFGTPVLVGTILEDATLGWKNETTVATAALAQAWLEAKAGTTPQVATPVPSVAAGTYAGTQSVTLSCATATAKIYYTTNGLTPTAADTEYTTTISVAASTMLKAVGILAQYSNSAIMSAEYIITA